MKTFVSILALLGALLLVLRHVQNAGADSLARRGHEAYGAGEYALAIDLYSKAIAQGSRADGLVALDGVYAGRGRAYLKVGDVSGAVADLRSVIELDPRHAEAHRELCPLLAEREGSEAALPVCLQAAKLGQPIAAAVKRELESVLCRLAEAAYSRGDHQAFLDRHRELAILSPNKALETFSQARLADSHYQLGEGLLRGGSPAAAGEHYKAAIDLDPGGLYRRRAVTALVTLGGSSEAEGDYGRAVICYERALELTGSLRRGELEARLEFARRMERCYSLKSAGDSALQRINWPVLERADKILASYNRGIDLTPEEALYLYTNSKDLADSVMALVEANGAYRDLMKADCPSRIVDGALSSNVDLILSWATKAGAVTEFLVKKMEEEKGR